MDKKWMSIHITSWKYTLSYAKHYYARLTNIYGDSSDEMEIKRKVTKEDVKNEDYNYYSIGCLTSRFDSFEDLIKVIRKEFKSHYLKKRYYLEIEVLNREICGNKSLQYWKKFFKGIPLVYIPYNWGESGNEYKFIKNG